MNAVFVPSLKHIVCVEVVIKISYTPEIQDLTRKLKFKWRNSVSDEKWNILLSKITEKISSLFIPVNMQEYVLNFLRPINIEIEMWLEDHEKVLKGYINRVVPDRVLHWKPEGTIDRYSTANSILKNKKYNTFTRFKMACYYGFEKDIMHLWNRMSIIQQQAICYVSSPLVVRVWTSWLQKGIQINWTGFAELHMASDFYKLSSDFLELLSFIHKLTSNERSECLIATIINRFRYNDDSYLFSSHIEQPEMIETSCYLVDRSVRTLQRKPCMLYALRRYRFRYHELRFCLLRADQKHLIHVFRQFPFQALSFYLEFPLQNFFMDVAACVWSYLSQTDFYDLLHIILCQKIFQNWKDFDYLDLLKMFWNASPPHFKAHVKNSNIFLHIMTIVKHDQMQPFNWEKLLQYKFEEKVYFTIRPLQEQEIKCCF